jgi:hypothetical protein
MALPVERATACATSVTTEIALMITLKASKGSQGKQRKLRAYLNYVLCYFYCDFY